MVRRTSFLIGNNPGLFYDLRGPPTRFLVADVITSLEPSSLQMTSAGLLREDAKSIRKWLNLTLPTGPEVHRSWTLCLPYWSPAAYQEAVCWLKRNVRAQTQVSSPTSKADGLENIKYKSAGARQEQIENRKGSDEDKFEQ